MSRVPTVPCPVRLGTVKSGGVAAQLHQFTRERNLHKAEKLLRQGVDVDCVNHLGQTSLFCASLLGFTTVANLLLQYGADPNHRCDDMSTPVHAAVFSSNTRLLSELLEAGGDLRLHDDQGRTPRDWAEIGAQEHSVRMVNFIKSCMSVMRSLCESQSPRERRCITPTSSKTLLHSPSLLDFLRPVSDVVFNKKLTAKSSTSDTVQCFGFGKLCVEKPWMSVGVLASIPLISDSELVQAEDEALHSFPCGSFTKMTNYSWRGSRVTVKELQIDNTQQHAERHGYHDLLITELSFCCRLFHPHLLHLMAVSSSNDLQQNKLVYERVHVGSLYTLLYHRRVEFPVLQVYEVLSLILQVCEALFYLHSQSLVLRSLSSHSVLVIHPGVAKVTGLGFMVSSDCSPSSSPPLPVMLYNWAAPEVIRRKSCTGKADLYSICALIQELYTDSVPWGSVHPRWIKRAIDAGQSLSIHAAVPQPYYDLLLNGLKPRAQERTCSLQDLRYTLRSDLRELSERERRSEVRPLLARSSPHRWSTEIRQNRDTEHPDKQQVVDQDIRDQLQEPDSFLENQTEQKCSLQYNMTENCTSTDKLLQDKSFQDVLPLDECNLSPCPPSVEEEDTEEEMKQPHVATQSSISNYISSTILNLKVSQLLLQQAESSLDIAESKMMRNTSPSASEVDEPDGLVRRREKKVKGLKAVGPPASEYIPTSCAAGALVGSSDSEEQRPLMDAQEQEDTQLEQLLKSFTAVHSESEETTNFHTINHTFTLPNTLWKVKGQHREEDDSDSDYAQSPVELSSIFYTPKHNPENTHAKEERSQTSNSEDDPDVTMEVCRPDMTIETTFRECRSSPEEPEHTAAESVPPSVHTTRSSHIADIADLSSITCSPALQLEECVGQNGAPPSPRSTRFPRCNSTPRSPHTHIGRGRREVCVSLLVPHLQSLMETSLWGSTESPSHTESYNTARREHTVTMHQSEPSVLQSPAERSFPQGDSDTPSSGNPEFTTARSGIRHSEEKKGQDHSDTPGPSGKTEAAQALCEEEEEQEEVMKDTMRDSCPSCSSDDPLDAAAPVLITARDELTADDDDDDVFIEEEEICKEPSDAEQNTESYGGKIPEEQQTQCPDPAQRLTVFESDTEKDRSSCNAAKSLEETKRAHSTLDEVLQGLLENPEEQRTWSGAAVITDVSARSDQETEWTFGPRVSAERGTCEQMEEKEEEEVMKEGSCSGGDTSEGAVMRGTNTITSGVRDVRNGQGEDFAAEHHLIFDQLHRRIVLERTPV